ncbi:MAG: DUF11 domain-containing protein, partial [Ignavibacteriales bacterium]|nr:DUF11 domain-containing protein [Ignavibacteriales bacterium]
SGTVTSNPAGIYCGAACTATFDAGTNVTLTASPDPSATFSGWGGDASGSSSSVTITMDGNKNVDALFQQQTFTLTVSKSGSGGGTVRYTPAAGSEINCDDAVCIFTLTVGSTVTLVATPDANSTFTGWSGDATGTSSSVTLTIDGNLTVTAAFTKIQYTLTINRTGSGTVTSNPAGIYCGAACTATFDAGTNVTLTASPDPSATFSGWGGDASGTSSPVTITMDGNKTVNATFTANTGSISNFVWKDLNGNGIQDSGEPGFANIQVNILDASTASVLGTTTTDASGLYVFTNVPSGNYKVEVIPPSGWGFTIKDNGSNDVIDSDVEMSTGFTDSFSLAAGATDDTRDAGLVSANTTTTKTGTSTVTVGGQIMYTITVINSGPTTALNVVTTDVLPSGTIYLSSYSSFGNESNYANNNGTVAITTPYLGSNETVTYTIVVTAETPGVKTNTASTTSDTPDPNGNDNSSSTTTIVDQQFTLTVAKTGTGVGTVTSSPVGIDCGSTCTYTFTAGTVVTLTATPDANSTFAGWSGAASGTGAAVITIDGNKSVTATFEKKSRSIMESILQDLISFRGTVSNKDDGKKLDDAIKNMNKALDLAYWVDGDHLQSQKGEKVFSESKDAVNKLRILMKEKKSSIADGLLQGFVDRIVQVLRYLVVVAINDAVRLQGDSKDITKANQELLKGDADISNSKYESGIEHYRNAWDKAMGSLPKALSLAGSVENEEHTAAEFIPSEFGLMQNYPNPFNPTTTISYNIAKESKVILKVFDILGREVMTLVDLELSPGNYRAEFNGNGLASGIYLYQIRAFPSEGVGNIFVDTKKFILMK